MHASTSLRPCTCPQPSAHTDSYHSQPQMYYDDLPVWGFIGKVEKIVQTGVHKYYLFTHFHFDLSYNDDRVIEINVSSDPMRTVDITSAQSMQVSSRSLGPGRGARGAVGDGPAGTLQELTGRGEELHACVLKVQCLGSVLNRW